MRRVNEIPAEDTRVSNRTRVFAGGMHRTCAMRLSRKTKQSYATERNPRNDFPSYAIYIAFHTCRPRHASFVSAVSTCKNPVWNEAEAWIRARRRSIEWVRVGGISPLWPSWHVATCRNSSSLYRCCGGTMVAGQLIFYGSTRRAWDARGWWIDMRKDE